MSSRSRSLFVALLVVITHPPLRADTLPRESPGFMSERSAGRSICRSLTTEEAHRFAVHDRSAFRSLGPARASLQAAAGLRVILRGTSLLDSHPEARAAFLRAAARWEELITTPVTLVIDVDFGPNLGSVPFPPSVLGSTMSQNAFGPWGRVRAALRSVATPGKKALYDSLPTQNLPTDIGPIATLSASSSLFRAIGLLSPVADPAGEKLSLGNPPLISFNSSQSWDFDPTDGIDSRATDFEALATHEIGHVLGFNSWVGVHEAFPSEAPVASFLDIFRFRPGSTPDFSTTQRVMKSGGAQAFFAGGPFIPLSTTGLDGQVGLDDFSASHWKAEIFTGFGIGIMDPEYGDGFRPVVTSRDLAALDAMGWNVAGPAPAEPSVRTVPIVLDAQGVGGARFSSELTLANRSLAPAAVDLTFTPADAFGGTAGGTISDFLEAGRQLQIPDAISYLRAKGLPIPPGNQGGTLRVTFRGDASPDSFFAGARTTAAAGGGRAGLSYAAIRKADGLGDRAFVFGLRETEADRTNLALFDMGESPVTLRVSLRSGFSATPFVTLPDVTLSPGKWLQLSRVLSGSGISEGWAEIERVQGDPSWAAYAVFNDNNTNDGSYVPALSSPLARAPLVVPVLVESETFASELVLANPSNTAALVTLTYVESAAAERGAGGSLSLPFAAFEQRIIPRALDWLRNRGVAIGPRGAATYAGTLTATFSVAGIVSPGLAGARTGAAGDRGLYGLFSPAVSYANTATWNAWVFGLQQSGTSRSNLAVINSGDARANLTLQVSVYDGATGMLAGTTEPFTLPPGGWKQFSGILSSFGIGNGYARVAYVSGSGSYIAYAVVNDGASPGSGGTNDGSYLAFSNR